MFALAVSILAAPPGVPPAASIVEASDPVELDGRLDDAAWRRAPSHPLAFQKQPRGGDPATLDAWWKAVVVDDMLYVGVRCEAGDVPMVVRRTRRDRDVESDRITVDIDTRGRGQDAFHFEITSGGSFVDGVRYNDTVFDKQWDSYWDGAVSTDDGGWSAELEIPLRLLRRPPGETLPVHIQVRRYISKTSELDEWAPTPRDNSREVSAYGEARGLTLPQQRARLDLLPYMSLGALIETPGGTGEMIRRGGGDAKLQIGSDVAIDVTAYPDFGTVEADTAVFNLSPREVRFPEKRPFFLEGTDVFNTPLEVFYSRRIGSLTGTTAGTAVEAPPPAPVLGATKLLARAGGKWSIGGLGAVTAPQRVEVRDPDVGVAAPQLVAPTYLYGGIRARREIVHGGYVGALAVSRTGFDRGPLTPWPVCPDGEAPARGSCFADVYAGGPDFRVRSPNGQWAGSGQIAATVRHGGTPSTGPDGNTVESGDVGGASTVKLEKTGGRGIGWLRYDWFGRDADFNATGFLPTPNRHFTRGHIAIQNLKPHGPVFEDRWQLEVFQRFSLDGVPLGSGYQANYRAQWLSRWSSFTELHWRPGYFNNREARDGTPVERVGLLGLELSLDSDPRRVAAFGFEGTYQQRWNGFRLEAEANVDFNIGGPVQLRLGVEATEDQGEPRWFDTDTAAGVYRLARLDAHAVGLLTRLNYTITPKLELQVYAQLLGVGTQFEDGFTAPLGVDRIRLDQLVADPDFEGQRESEALLVANLFLRWEYAPGSNVYLVATRNQLDTTNDDGDGRIDYSSIGRTAAAYTFLAKVTMLFGR